MSMELLLETINYLSNKSKEGALTQEELELQAKLRQAYLKQFRESLRIQVEHVRIFDMNGDEVTPEKLRQLQQAKQQQILSEDLPSKMELFLKQLP